VAIRDDETRAATAIAACARLVNACGRSWPGGKAGFAGRGYSNPDVPPAPRRRISGFSWRKSMTVVGSVPQSPESITRPRRGPSLVGDLPSLGHGLVLARQQQGARDERLTEFGQQRLGHHNAGGSAPRTVFFPGCCNLRRYLFGRGQDEGNKRPGWLS